MALNQESKVDVDREQQFSGRKLYTLETKFDMAIIIFQ